MPASAVEATLVADAHVNVARPNANSGTLSNLNVGGGYTSLLQFDLGILPAGTTTSQISRAVLRLYCNRADTPGAVSLQAINSPWGEYSVTYSNLPGMAAASGTLSVNQEGTYLSIDVTALVQGWVATPSSNNGIALTSSSAVVQFDSKENDLTGHAPVLDITVVSQGPAGPKGDAGAPGQQGIPGTIGPIGPAGTQGPKGDSGPAGVAGAQGPAGATGPQGPAGPIGLQGQQGIKGDPGSTGAAGSEGPAGKPGLVYRGTYTSTFFYAQGDVVFWQGTAFVSLADGNGNSPDAGAPWWGILADHGATGPQGQVGAQGPAGPVGPQGLTGLQGASGPVGPIGPQGTAGLTGANGAIGPQGTQGPIGPTGPPGFVGATGPQGPQGSAGPVGATGTVGPQGPAGPTGAAGPQGSPGPVGMTFRGNYSPS
ncbi:MAG TPA: DNRLRE domain-containing protein, partial [Edaphobacter sp.]